jgi:hypothetical protein
VSVHADSQNEGKNAMFRKLTKSALILALLAATGVSLHLYAKARTLQPLLPSPSVAAAAKEPPATPPEKKVLESRLAGNWYEADPAALRKDIEGYLAKADPPALGPIQALILPHAGYRYSAQTAAYAIKTVQGKHFKRVIVMGPSHHVALRDTACLSDYTHYRTPLGEVPLDTAFIAQLKKNPMFTVDPRAELPEHSVQIELPLLQVALGPFALVPIIVGQLDLDTARGMAQFLAPLLDDETLVVASSDFTHYGQNYDYVPFKDDVQANLKKLDMGAADAITAKDAKAFHDYVEKTGATICGRFPITVLLSMLPKDAAPQLLRYDTSGALTGDFTMSVSYCAFAVTGAWPKTAETTAEPALSEADKKTLLSLARKSIAYALENKKAPAADALGLEITPAMKLVRGAFVTLKEKGDLRGCIGDIFASRALADAIAGNAYNAAFRDPRFDPLAASELPQVSIEISVLTPLTPVKSPDEIVVGKHGVLLTKGGYRAVFLPQVAPEQGWDRDTMLTHLALKAGLSGDAWKNGASFEVFEAIVFGEDAR